VDEVVVYGRPAALRVVASAEKLMALTPLQHLRFSYARLYSLANYHQDVDTLRLADIAPLLHLPAVVRLRTLDLSGHQLGDGLAGLLMGVPHLTPRTHLQLAGNRIGRDLRAALVERFGNSVTFEGLGPPPPPANAENEDDIPF
jgi:hypothetical protein